MPAFTATISLLFGNRLYTKNVQETYGTLESTGPVSVNAGKAGTLSTRTSDTEGEITGSTGHGISTGERIDIQWADGRRYNVLVGTVNGNAIPISDGAGDVLPAGTTALVFCKPKEINTAFDGSDLMALAAKSSQEGVFALHSDAGVQKAYDLDGSNAEQWIDGQGVDNPIDGDSITKLTISNFSTTTVASFNVDTLLDSES